MCSRGFCKNSFPTSPHAVRCSAALRALTLLSTPCQISAGTKPLSSSATHSVKNQGVDWHPLRKFWVMCNFIDWDLREESSLFIWTQPHRVKTSEVSSPITLAHHFSPTFPPPPFFFLSTLNVTYCPFRCYWEADCFFFFFSHKCYSWSVLSLLFILLTPAYKGTLTYLHLIPLPFCILWMFPCVGEREKERVVSLPQISTEQHVADVKKACRFPLCITTGVLEGERGGVY